MRLRLPDNRTLLIVAVGLVAVWFVLRSQGMNPSQLPWNKGQAGSIFQGGLMGGGQ